MAIEEREIALDTETTGFKPQEGHRLVEIGCVEMINRVRTDNTFHVYINPERDMPEGAFKVHGLSEEFLRDKPLFKDVADDFLKFIGDSRLIIHNADFDMRFLNAELLWEKKRELPMSRAFCTLKYARKQFPGAPATLDALCKKFNVDLSERTLHGALIDAALLAEMYLELMGGRQNAMSLEKDSAPTEQLDEATGLILPTSKTIRPIRSHAATAEELEAHAAFVADTKWYN